MSRKKAAGAVLACMMALTMTACGGANGAGDQADQTGTAQGEAQALTKVDVVLDWYPNVIHTFLYEAIDNGYFADEGLEVNLVSPAESVDAITFVAAGRAQIGLTYPVEVIEAKENGMPVQALGAVSQKPLDCLCSLASNTAVTSDMASLKGKKIGYSGTSVAEATVRTIMKNAGLTEQDYELVDVGFDLVTSLTTGSVDLVAGTFLNDEVVTMRNAGYDVNVYSEQDYGVPELYGLVMAVNEEAYEKQPEVYEGFLTACEKGFADMKADEDAALELIMQKMNSDDNPLDEEQQRESYEILLPRMEPEGVEFLSMQEKTWQDIADWMLESGLISEAPSVQDLVAGEL